MSGQFAGKTVGITRAAGGTGQWLCRFFGEEGATIAALDRSEKVMELADTLRVCGITVKSAVTDIANADDVTAAFARFGDVHLLINNARVSSHPTLAVTDPAGWQADVAANLNGAYACAHAVLPQMGAPLGLHRQCRLGQRPDGAWRPSLQRRQAGMISLTRSLAQEYGRYGIRANCVLPGTVRAPIWDERKAKGPNVLKQLERWYPLGRIVEPDEVARVIAFLASDAASAVTGVALPIVCGLTTGNIVMARELTLEDFLREGVHGPSY